jgi:hypothetical protein
VSIVGLANLSVRCVCVARCVVSNVIVQTNSSEFPSLSAHVVYIDGREGVSNVSGVHVALHGVENILLEAPSSTIMLFATQCNAITWVTFTMTSCPMSTFSSWGLNLGLSSRTQGLVVAIIPTVSRLVMNVTNSTLNFTAESGGCNSVVVGAFQLTRGSSTDIQIDINDVQMESVVANGTVLVMPTLPFIAGLTMLSTFVNLIGTSDLRLNITNSTIQAMHTCNLPAGILMAIVISVVTSIHSLSEMDNATVALEHVFVLRRHPDTELSWFPGGDASLRYNFTSLLHMLEASMFVVNYNTFFDSFRQQILDGMASEGATSSSSLTGSRITMRSGCRVRYDP